MKKTFLVLGLLMLGTLLVSCDYSPPDLDFSAVCQDIYDDVVLVDPSFPSSFVTVCVKAVDTGTVAPFTAYCRYEAFRDYVNVNNGEDIYWGSQQECIMYTTQHK